MLFHFFERLQRSCEHCFFTFYRHRAARKQYSCRFIVTVQRGNNICAVLSSPRGAETIFLPFYRRRAARKQYFCRFIVTARRGNNIFAVLSSPCSAGIIFLHFIVCSITASIKIFVFTFAERRCVFGMVGAVPVCPPERPRSGVSIPKYICASRIMHGD